MKKYKLIISRFFKSDLEEAAEYIKIKYKNPQAAKRLISKANKAIHNRLFMPLAAEPYNPEGTDDVYYRIYVDNYIVFYSVNGDTMEVRRFIHGSRDLGRLL